MAKDRINLRISQEDKEKIKKRADSLGLTLSDFIRQSALYATVVQYKVLELNNLVYEINKIGTNINQIAKICNQSQSVSPVALQNLQNRHSELYSLMTNVLVTNEDRAKLIEILHAKKY